MAGYCALVPTCRNKKGEHVESKLWQDLYALTGKDRAKTKKLYKIATSDTFLNSVKDIADYDVNGQITAHSFLSLSEREGEIDNIVQALEDKYGTKVNTGEEIEALVERFNREESFSKSYVPVVYFSDEDESAAISYAKRTPQNVDKLQKALENNKLTSLIISRLKNLGVAYDFVGKRVWNGRFSIDDASLMADGLRHLIQLSAHEGTTEEDVQDAIVEEAAHLAVMSMRDSSIMKRLLDSITTDNLNKLFTPEELRLVDLNAPNAKLELAGILVKKILLNKAPSSFSGFLGRVQNAIYSIFSKIGINKILSDRIVARESATALANGFLYNDTTQGIENILAEDNPLTLYSLDASNSGFNILRSVFKSINVLRARMTPMSSSLVRNDVFQQLRLLANPTKEQIDAINDDSIQTIVADAIKILSEELLSKFDSLDAVFSNKDNYELHKLDFNKMNDLYEASEIVHTLREIQKALLSSKENIFNEHVKAIDAAFTTENNIIISNRILEYERLFSTAMMEDIYGVSAIRRRARLAFNIDTKRVKLGFISFKRPILSVTSKAGTPINEEGDTIDTLTRSYVDELSYDSTWWSKITKVFRNKNNSKDVTTQAFYQYVNLQKINSARRYNIHIDELEGIVDYIKKNKVDVVRLYERYKDNSFTGYFISEINISQYLQDRHKAEYECRTKYVEYLKSTPDPINPDKTLFDVFKSKTTAQRYEAYNTWRDTEVERYTITGGVLNEAAQPWIDFLEASMEKDSEGNFIVDERGNFVVNKDKYHNKAYKTLTEEELEALRLITEYKNNIDITYLNEREDLDDLDSTTGRPHYVQGRIPQYKDKTLNTVYRNLTDSVDLEEWKVNNPENGIGEIDIRFSSDSFGDALTEDLQRKDSFADDYSFAAANIRSLPLNGIKMLDDMRTLSTNLIACLAEYTKMAVNYGVMNNVYSKLMVMDDTFAERTKGDATAEFARSRDDLASQERQNVLSELVYGRTKKYMRGTVLSMIAAIRVLCLSYFSGLKNYLGGLSVVIVDAISGNSTANLGQVLKSTFSAIADIKHIAGTAGQTVLNKEMVWDHRMMLLHRWDSFRNPRMKTRLGKRPSPFQYITNFIMSNYAITDDAILGTIYDSQLGDKKVYDVAENKVVSLRNAYDFKNKAGKNIEPKLKVLLKKEEYKPLYEDLKFLLDEIEAAVRENERNINEGNADFVITAEQLFGKVLYSGTDPEVEKRINRIVNTIKNSKDLIGRKDADLYLTEEELISKNGGYKSYKEISKIIQKKINKMLYTVDDEARDCQKVNDYITSSQGIYGLINSTEFQLNAGTAAFGKIKGYLFGFMQRNLFTNYSMLNQEYKSSVLEATMISFALAFGGYNNIKIAALEGASEEETKANIRQMKKAIWAATLLPFVVSRDSKLRRYFISNGWDPDQISKLMSAFIGHIFYLCTKILARLIWRGNERTVGNQKAMQKNVRKSNRPYMYPGLLFPKKYSEVDDDAFKRSYELWEGQDYPYAVNQASEYKSIQQKGDPNSSIYNNGVVYYVRSEDKYYTREMGKRGLQWKEVNWGHYIPVGAGEDEWLERVIGMKRKNIYYSNHHEEGYYAMGFFYRLLRGVNLEQATVWTPAQFVNDLFSLSRPLIQSAGLSVIGGFAEDIWDIIMNDKFEAKALKKERDFWLNKWNFEINGDGPNATIFGINLPENWHVTKKDWYDVQERSDNYTKQQEAINTFRGIKMGPFDDLLSRPTYTDDELKNQILRVKGNYLKDDSKWK